MQCLAYAARPCGGSRRPLLPGSIPCPFSLFNPKLKPPTHRPFPCLLSRGVALEALGRWEEAIADYRAVLAAAPNDPAGWNNLGNASGGCRARFWMRVWCGCVLDLGRAACWGRTTTATHRVRARVYAGQLEQLEHSSYSGWTRTGQAQDWS